jgi:quinol monooxygenase YgiN
VSVIVIIKVPGDVAKASATFAAQGDFLNQTSRRAQADGCLHHKFAAGDGEIVVIDEWRSREAFERFFADPSIAQFVAEAGASGPPVVEFYEALESAGDF